MTDAMLAGDEAQPDPESPIGGVGDDLEGAPPAAGAPSGRLCQEPGCTNELPPGSHQARKYCDEHFRGKGGREQRRREGQSGEKPPRLVVDLGGKRSTTGKGDQRARETAAGAAAFLGVVATGLAVSGDAVCAGAVSSGAAQWGEAVGELSKYQPWLQSFFAPVGGDNQLGAWLGFMLATGAIALPVMAHHGILPASVGAKLGGVFVAADDVVTDQRIPGAA